MFAMFTILVKHAACVAKNNPGLINIKSNHQFQPVPVHQLPLNWSFHSFTYALAARANRKPPLQPIKHMYSLICSLEPDTHMKLHFTK